MRTKLFTPILLALALLIPAAAAPVVISYSDTQATDFSPGNLQFILQGFDPALGTLQSVMFVFSGELEATGSVTNNSEEDGTIDGSVNALFEVNGPAPLGTILTVNPFAPLGPQPIAAGETIVYDPAIAGSDSDSITFSDPADLLAFITAGTLAFDGMSTSFVAPIANFTPVTFSFLQQGSATLEVFYTFDDDSSLAPIPEPSTLTLFAAGGLLLGLSRLRRRRHS